MVSSRLRYPILGAQRNETNGPPFQTSLLWDWNQRIHWLEDTQSVASLDLNTVGPKDSNLHLDHLMHLTGTASARQAGVWLLQNWSPGNSSLKLRLISDMPGGWASYCKVHCCDIVGMCYKHFDHIPLVCFIPRCFWLSSCHSCGNTQQHGLSGWGAKKFQWSTALSCAGRSGGFKKDRQNRCLCGFQICFCCEFALSLMVFVSMTGH